MSNIVAIVGRPNVGKSTIFNRLTETRQAITDEISGVTRDRHYGKSEWNGREFSVIDTGGYVHGSEDIFEVEIRKQVELAIDEANVILFLVDAKTGITDLDQSVVNMLRKTNKKVVLSVNKVDNKRLLDDAVEFFKAIPAIRGKFNTLQQVGLGYIKLGQPATTLSGGEAQRVKLARELSKRDTGKTLYILDEPTTGLHFHDIQQLLDVIHRLRDHGNTMVVIEHNLDVIKTADWIIDLGPEGGSGGGSIIATGSPEDLAKMDHSSTAQFLKPML